MVPMIFYYQNKDEDGRSRVIPDLEVYQHGSEVRVSGRTYLITRLLRHLGFKYDPKTTQWVFKGTLEDVKRIKEAVVAVSKDVGLVVAVNGVLLKR